MTPQPDLSWTWQPLVVAALAGALGVYVAAWRRARTTGGSGAAGGWRLASFVAGVAALFAALASPLAKLGEQLFVAHMAQHILLLDVAALLLICGLTPALLRPLAARGRAVSAIVRPLSHPVVAVLAYGGMLWFWHIPAMYELALRNGAAHAVQHILFVGAGLVFWAHVISPQRLRGTRPVVYLASAKLVTGVLASALAFTPLGAYAFYAEQPRWWGLSPGDDQRAAGGLMMTEELTLMTIALGVLFIRMLGESEREEARRERLAEA